MSKTEVSDFQIVENPAAWVGRTVHVEGWGRGCWFILKSYEDGEAVLITSKTNKVYKTRNRLLKTRKNES